MMEPGDYHTNILTINNLFSIHYEYFVPQSPLSTAAKYELQRLEARWRQDGKLVYCDPLQDRIWVFQDRQQSDSPQSSGSLNFPEIQVFGYLHRESGILEPASLMRNKNVPSFSHMQNNCSSGLFMDNSIKNLQAYSDRNTKSTTLGDNSHESMKTSGMHSAGTKSATASLNEIHENFISAVLGSIMSYICRDNGYIPFNSRTLISASSHSPLNFSSPNAVEFATLDINLTSMGTLVIKAYFGIAHNFRSLTFPLKTCEDSLKPESGAPLWLAPGGNPALFYRTLDDIILNIFESSSNHEVKLIDGSFNANVKLWQRKCLEWLSFKGLDPAVGTNGWLLVQILDDNFPLNSEYLRLPIPDDLKIVLWPAALCFQNLPKQSHELFRSYFGIASPIDPLSFAEEWFNSQEQRANIISKRKNNRKIDEALSKERADIEARAALSHLNSPVALRRRSISGNIYPTPPDALHHLVGATPSFDGNSLISGNSNNCTNIEALTTNVNINVPNDNPDRWMSSEKREQVSSSFNFNDDYPENDNLFNDLDEAMFGSNVTDADFNFFDEPDVEPMELEGRSPTPSHPTSQEPKLIEDDVSDCIHPETVNDLNGVSLSKSSKTLKNQRKFENKRMLSECQVEQNITLKETSSLPKPQTCLDSFNQNTVFRKLIGENSREIPRKKINQCDLYDKINFSRSLDSVNQKYGSSGRFKFSVSRFKNNGSEIAGLPRTEYLKKRKKKKGNLPKKKQISPAALCKKTMPLSANGNRDISLESVYSSQNSEQDDLSSDEADNYISCRLGTKREWESDENEETTSTLETSAIEPENVTTPTPVDSCHIPFLNSDPANWPLKFYVCSKEPESFLNTLSDLEYVATTQILANQAVSGTFKLPGSLESDISYGTQKHFSTKKLLRSLVNSAKHYFNDVNVCKLRNFLDVQGIHVSNQVLRLPPRPNTNLRGPLGANDRPNNPFLISLPQLEVRRSDSSLSVLPAAVPYWENLGLGPSAGAKNIEAVCVYPDLDGIAMNASLLLDRMRSVYESSRFGTHQRVVSKDLTEGLFPFTVDSLQPNNSKLLTLKEIMGQLSLLLSCLTSQNKNLVIYFVYFIHDNTLLVQVCSAFQHLLSMYRKVLLEKKMVATNEVVLQLIPLTFIASPTCLAVPKPSEYFELALELYDRCTDFTSTSSMPAITLEQPLPKSIDFKLNSNPSASLLHENACLHIAYAESFDGRWITVAWTDNRGAQQMTASYCLGRKRQTISTTFAKVANEIWETTLDFISDLKIHRRIIIAKIGVMDHSEIEIWTSLASTESNAQINLILVTVQSEPSLQLLPNPVSLSSNGATGQNPTAPGSVTHRTPPTIWPPENISNMIEMPTEADIDARLIDSTDQTWGAVLSHRLNNSNSLLEINLALVSGYLIKRGGMGPNDSPLVLEVNIIYSEIMGNPRTFHESLLREILGYYRGLGTLARARGIVDAVRDTRPWHIAAVEKAIQALSTLM